MLSQRGKPLLVHDGHTFGIQYIRKDKKYWQCNLSRKFNCKARVTTTESGEIIVTNNEHCHTEIRQHLRKEYKQNRLNSLSHSFMQQQAMRLSQLSQVAGGAPLVLDHPTMVGPNNGSLKQDDQHEFHDQDNSKHGNGGNSNSESTSNNGDGHHQHPYQHHHQQQHQRHVDGDGNAERSEDDSKSAMAADVRHVEIQNRMIPFLKEELLRSIVMSQSGGGDVK